jgi:hypothetical protein
MDQTLFFHKFSEDKDGKPLMSSILKTAVIKRSQVKFNGIVGHMRSTESVDTHYVLLIVTDANGKAIDPRTLKFEKDQPVPGVIDSGKPVLDREGQPTGLTWATMAPQAASSQSE